MFVNKSVAISPMKLVFNHAGTTRHPLGMYDVPTFVESPLYLIVPVGETPFTQSVPPMLLAVPHVMSHSAEQP